jgi:hypothetical protein
MEHGINQSTVKKRGLRNVKNRFLESCKFIRALQSPIYFSFLKRVSLDKDFRFRSCC